MSDASVLEHLQRKLGEAFDRFAMQIAILDDVVLDRASHPDRALCVHDWVVPAPEEMLSLHLLLQLPGWESYLRRDEHDWELLELEHQVLHN